MTNQSAQQLTLPTTNPLIDLSVISQRQSRMISAKVGKVATAAWLYAAAIAATYREMENILTRSVVDGRETEFDLRKARETVGPICGGDMSRRLAATLATYAVVTATPEYVAARDEIEPLLVEATTQAIIARQDLKKAKEDFAEKVKRVDVLRRQAEDLTASRHTDMATSTTGITEASTIEIEAVAQLKEARAELEKAKENVASYEKILAGDFL